MTPASELIAAVAEAGGVDAPPSAGARIGRLLARELVRGGEELVLTRSGYGAPVVLAAAGHDGRLLVACPLDRRFAADPDRAPDRGRLLAAAVVGALVELGPSRAFNGASDLRIEAGALEGDWLVLAGPVQNGHETDAAQLFADALEAHAAIDRLRTTGLALPGHMLARATGLRQPLAAAHPLCLAEAVALRGGRPASSDSFEEHEDEVLAVLGPESLPPLPHDDPFPERRIARRILQRLDGLGKWGGYHTEFRHLGRGFHGNDARAALDVAQHLVRIGFLKQKQSVGQRHVYLDPARSGDIRRAIGEGEFPPGTGFDGAD